MQNLRRESRRAAFLLIAQYRKPLDLHHASFRQNTPESAMKAERPGKKNSHKVFASNKTSVIFVASGGGNLNNFEYEYLMKE